MIESVLQELMAGTYKSNLETISQHEKSFRWIARENRTRRRMLARYFIELLESTESDFRASRVVTPILPDDPYYLFLLLPHYPTWTGEDYRRIRAKMLTDYCLVVKLQFPDARHIIGIATESGIYDPRFPDLSHFDSVNWTPELAELAKSLKRDMGIFTETKTFTRREWEYPLGQPQEGALISRNSPCFCGSGRRYKRCHGAGMFGKKRGKLC